MPDISFASQVTFPGTLFNNHNPDAIEQFCRANGLGKHQGLYPGQAYTQGNDPAGALIVKDFNQFTNLQERGCVEKACQALGEDVHILGSFFEAVLSEDFLSKTNTFIGASSTAATTRISAFEMAIKTYENALIALHKLTRSGAGNGRPHQAAVLAAKNKVRAAYQTLQQQFSIELTRFSHESRRAKNSGDAFSNAERGITLATRHPNSHKVDTRIKVADRQQARTLARTGYILNRVGQAALVLDAGMRIDHIRELHEEGGDWMKESAKQMTGYGLGGAVGMIAGRGVMAGGGYVAMQAGLTLVGPAGWVLLGVLLAASLTAGYFAGSMVDQKSQSFTEKVWERRHR